MARGTGTQRWHPAHATRAAVTREDACAPAACAQAIRSSSRSMSFTRWCVRPLRLHRERARGQAGPRLSNPLSAARAPGVENQHHNPSAALAGGADTGQREGSAPPIAPASRHPIAVRHVLRSRRTRGVCHAAAARPAPQHQRHPASSRHRCARCRPPPPPIASCRVPDLRLARCPHGILLLMTRPSNFLTNHANTGILDHSCIVPEGHC